MTTNTQASAPLADCPNCSFSLHLPGIAPDAVRHCPSCGQETTLHSPSVVEFAHEFVSHYVALDGPLWRTLWLLVRHPGQLTAAYLAGKRRQFVPPLRLYLSASFVLFLVLKFLAPSAEHALNRVGAQSPSGATSASAVDSISLGAHRPGSTQHVLEAPASQAAVHGTAAASAPAQHRAGESRDTPYNMFLHGLSLAPYLLFLMLPVFAGVLGLAYFNRRRRLGEHVVFAMHFQAFAFFLAALLALIPPTHDGGMALLFLPFYGFIALRRVYGGRWWPTLTRLLAVAVINAALLLLATVGLASWLMLH